MSLQKLGAAALGWLAKKAFTEAEDRQNRSEGYHIPLPGTPTRGRHRPRKNT